MYIQNGNIFHTYTKTLCTHADTHTRKKGCSDVALTVCIYSRIVSSSNYIAQLFSVLEYEYKSTNMNMNESATSCALDPFAPLPSLPAHPSYTSNVTHTLPSRSKQDSSFSHLLLLHTLCAILSRFIYLCIDEFVCSMDVRIYWIQ